MGQQSLHQVARITNCLGKEGLVRCPNEASFCFVSKPWIVSGSLDSRTLSEWREPPMVLENGTFRVSLPMSIMLYSTKFIKQTSCWCCTSILGESTGKHARSSFLKPAVLIMNKNKYCSQARPQAETSKKIEMHLLVYETQT